MPQNALFMRKSPRSKRTSHGRGKNYQSNLLVIFRKMLSLMECYNFFKLLLFWQSLSQCPVTCETLFSLCVKLKEKAFGYNFTVFLLYLSILLSILLFKYITH